jgi:hypothetical protein
VERTVVLGYEFDMAIGLLVADEARSIQEWLAYYIAIGVEHFWVFVNDADQTNMLSAMYPFVVKGFVETIHIPQRVCSHERQTAVFQQMIERARTRTKWLGILDADEFVYMRHADNLPQFMQAYEMPEVAALAVSWRNFGSNGHKTIQPSTLQAYTRRTPDDAEVNRHVKLILRPERITRMAYSHAAVCAPGYKTVDEHHNPLAPESCFGTGTADLVRINHYQTRSYEDWLRRKARGQVDRPEPYSEDFFIGQDRNEVQDTEILRHLMRVRQVLEEICGVD